MSCLYSRAYHEVFHIFPLATVWTLLVGMSLFRVLSYYHNHNPSSVESRGLLRSPYFEHDRCVFLGKIKIFMLPVYFVESFMSPPLFDLV